MRQLYHDERSQKTMRTWNNYKEFVKSIDDVNRIEIEELEMHAKIVSEIIARRNSLGLSQRDLAAICGIPQSSLARIETFKIIPKMDTVLKIMKPIGLGLTVTSLK